MESPPPPAASRRPRTESILEEAGRLVDGHRGEHYGEPLDNHGATAEMFAVYLERKYGIRLPLDAEDTCWFNILQKASRDAEKPNRDNLVDVAGYAENIQRIRDERLRRASSKVRRFLASI